MFVVTGTAIVTTRIFENFLGKPIKEATFSSPIKLVGFESMPEVGSVFESFNTKKEAENYANNIREEINNKKTPIINETQTGKVIPIVIKTDVMGTIEALEKEISKLNNNEISFKIISAGVGAINEGDIKTGNINKESIIVGFNIKMDNGARDLNESLKVNVQIFNIIYKLIDWLKVIIEERRPRTETVEVTGSLKVLKKFGATKTIPIL